MVLISICHHKTLHKLANKTSLKQLLISGKNFELLYDYINVLYLCSDSDSESESELQ